jgi:hypothetical protein
MMDMTWNKGYLKLLDQILVAEDEQLVGQCLRINDVQIKPFDEAFNNRYVNIREFNRSGLALLVFGRKHLVKNFGLTFQNTSVNLEM